MSETSFNSSAPKMKIFRNLALYWSMVRYANSHNDDFAKEQYQSFSEMLERLKSYGLEGVEDKRVLDVGCGKSMWMSILLNSLGANVTGIDTEVPNTRKGLGKYIEIARENGLERVARTFVWDTFYAKPYYRKLEEVSGVKLQLDNLDARQGSAYELEFETDSIDLVVSHEVLEHIPDIEATAKELSRVMKPNGLTHLYVHNYASVSGGHHIAWKYPDTEPSDTVPPWDHLRDNTSPDIPSWINRFRISDYRKAFEKHFDILDWVNSEKEGVALLTPEIKEELSEYSEEELLTKGFTIIARPKRGRESLN